MYRTYLTLKDFLLILIICTSILYRQIKCVITSIVTIETSIKITSSIQLFAYNSIQMQSRYLRYKLKEII